MEQDRLPRSLSEEWNSQRAVFQRVWGRVSPGENSPIEVIPALPAEAAPALRPTPAGCGEQLQTFLAGELESWRTYQALARWAGGRTGQALEELAREEYRHARQLGTAYFLLSGVQYWPLDWERPRRSGTLAGGLRERFRAQQGAEQAYRAAAGSAADGDLRELYARLAEEERVHAARVRRILEGS